MKLFAGLNEEQQANAVSYCAQMIVEDMIVDGVLFDPISEEEEEIKEIIIEAVELAKSEEGIQNQINSVMNNDRVVEYITDIALELARSAFYKDDSELSIFISDLSPEEVEEQEISNIDDIVESNEESLTEDERINTAIIKKNYTVN